MFSKEIGGALAGKTINELSKIVVRGPVSDNNELEVARLLRSDSLAAS